MDLYQYNGHAFVPVCCVCTVWVCTCILWICICISVTNGCNNVALFLYINTTVISALLTCVADPSCSFSLRAHIQPLSLTSLRVLKSSGLSICYAW